MASNALPLRVRTNVRDLIESPDSAVATNLAALGKIIGYPISLDPEWSMLWAELKPYHEPEAFIPNIALVIISWRDAFTQWLEAKENEERVEALLEEMPKRVKVLIEITTSSTRPTTVWLRDKLAFVISLPKGPNIPLGTIQAGLASDFLLLLVAEKPVPRPALASDDPEWADVSIEAEARTSAPLPLQQNVSDRLPDLDLIPRPDELLKKPPYWLLVTQQDYRNVVVRGSHSPSLECMEAYLKKWCRGNPHVVNRPPLAKVTLLQSAFGLGLVNDGLMLEAAMGAQGVNVMLLLAFIENVLGYTQVLETSTAGSVWEFKRTVGFR